MIATDSPRAKALRKLTAEIGPHAVPQFMRARQPDFDDMTGAEILQQRPEELLQRLSLLEEHRELETIMEGGPDDE